MLYYPLQMQMHTFFALILFILYNTDFSIKLISTDVPGVVVMFNVI